MSKIFTIVGARPNFIKLDPELKQTIVHTGQHYDKNMSDVFLKGFKPKYNLNCKGNQVGRMIDKLRPILKREQPDLVLVFGDTHSSLAGALAACYEKIKVVHVEAGLRSYTNMPEEINRKLIDKIADIKLCPTERALLNLVDEHLEDNAHLVGDPMFDALTKRLPIKKTNNYRKYILITLHREANATNDYIKKLFRVLESTDEQYIFPAHPRIKKFVKNVPKNVKIIEPQKYEKMLELESNAKKIITDSGGVQKEGAWMNVPVIVMREETEWVELVNKGSIKLSKLEELKNDIENFKGAIISAPTGAVNKKIREIIYKHV